MKWINILTINLCVDKIQRANNLKVLLISKKINKQQQNHLCLMPNINQMRTCWVMKKSKIWKDKGLLLPSNLSIVIKRILAQLELTNTWHY